MHVLITIRQQMIPSQLSRQQSTRYLPRGQHSVRCRTGWSIQLQTLTTWQRIHRQQNPVSVIQIWHLRWLNTARTTFLHRLDSLCWHRQIREHRVYSPYCSKRSESFKKQQDNFAEGRKTSLCFCMNAGEAEHEQGNLRKKFVSYE